MSEKKTAEIKLRIEPSVKAQWQQSAADESIGLSEFVVKACTEYGWAKQNHNFDSITLIDSAIAALATANGVTGEEVDCLFSQVSAAAKSATLSQPVTTSPVPTSEAEKKFGEDWKPWS